jgi:ATP-dependent HslUV protease ATP-binding subunit HslU
MAEEVTPKNILMIGPTGVGKTEIARRLARLAHSPFIKVEASKFTEVGYVGRDVESMVRDLVELAVDMVRAEKGDEVKDKAHAAAEERLLDLLLPPSRPPMPGEDPTGREQTGTGTRERMREQLRDGRLDERSVELDIQAPAMPSFEIIAGSSVEEIGTNLKDMVGNMFGGRAKTRRLKVPQALEQLTAEEQSKLLDMETVSKTAVQRVEQAGIIFVDEIDKIASRDGAGRRPWSRCQPRRRAARHPPDSSKAPPSTPSTGWSRPITSCSLLPAPSTSRSRRISYPNCRAASPSESSSSL